MAGYSKRALAEKLGIKSGMRCLIRNAPKHFRGLLRPLPDDVAFVTRAAGRFDFIHLFATQRAALQRELPRLRGALAPDGMLWISWPKGGRKASPPTDLTGTIVRDAGLDAGLVDVKVAAIDERWSGLKFVYRLSDRPRIYR